jgi:CheY-like chemotaxis protein
MLQPITFMLVDDDIDDTFLFREIINDVAPYIALRTAGNGQEALDALNTLVSENAPLPDLIFLDLNMPRMDGKQCLSLLKSSDFLQHIPVIMYTTSSHSRDIEETMLNGAVSFITKPSHISDLKTILASLAANVRRNLLLTLRQLSETQNTFIVC